MLKTITTEQKTHNILLNITTPLEFTTVKRYNNIEVKKMDYNNDFQQPAKPDNSYCTYCVDSRPNMDFL